MISGSQSVRIGDLLVKRGFLALPDLESALAQQRQRPGGGQLLGEILVDSGYCTEEQVVECLAAEYGVPFARLDARLCDPRIVDVLPRDMIEQNLILPLFVV